MGQIMNGMAKAEMTYSLKCRAGTTGQVANGITEEMTYVLKVQRRYDGSHRK